MPSRRGSPLPWTVLLLSTLFFSGCIRVANLSHSALKYNEAVEQAQNQMLLLNIVRAKMFRPMYITDLTKVTGSIKLDLNSGGLETDYGPYYNSLLKGTGSLTSGKLTPSVDYTQNPTFEVNSLSQQDFMKGFTSPCTKDLLAYYWEQGWPPEFLLYLFVHDVDDHGKHYENYPDPLDPDLRKLERFGHWVTDFVKKNPRFVRSDLTIGPCLESKSAMDLTALVSANKEGLSLADLKDGWQLKQQKQDMFLMDEARASAYEAEQKAKRCKSPVTKESEGEKPKTIEERLRDAPVLNLRSPEGIIFYLGELMRVEQQVKYEKFPAVCIGNRLWPLFVAFGKSNDKSATTCKEVSLAVAYEGKEYIIPDREQTENGVASPICEGLEIRPDKDLVKPKPGDEAATSPPLSEKAMRAQPKKFILAKDLNCFGGMSMEAFSLLTQLIALQKSAKDTPTTSVVRAIVQ